MIDLESGMGGNQKETQINGPERKVKIRHRGLRSVRAGLPESDFAIKKTACAS
jgi:hypothetical protein